MGSRPSVAGLLVLNDPGSVFGLIVLLQDESGTSQTPPDGSGPKHLKCLRHLHISIHSPNIANRNLAPRDFYDLYGN